MPIIAEDLGVITPDVEALRKRFSFPGMRILQFAFDGDARNPYLPHHHEPDTVVYTGTHDNDTSIGWWAGAGEHERHFARAYLGTRRPRHGLGADPRRLRLGGRHRDLSPCRTCWRCPSASRMNFPGQSEGWWEWRMQWSQVHPWHAQRLAGLCELFDRSGRGLQTRPERDSRP